jgi:hypothetical protein
MIFWEILKLTFLHRQARLRISLQITSPLKRGSRKFLPLLKKRIKGISSPFEKEDQGNFFPL